MIDRLFEVLDGAEQLFIDAATDEERHAAATAWLTIADLLQELGEKDCHI